MSRPYRIRINIENDDKGASDRTEVQFPKMHGKTSKEVADRIEGILNAKLAEDEHERLVAIQNKEDEDAESDPK